MIHEVPDTGLEFDQGSHRVFPLVLTHDRHPNASQRSTTSRLPKSLPTREDGSGGDSMSCGAKGPAAPVERSGERRSIPWQSRLFLLARILRRLPCFSQRPCCAKHDGKKASWPPMSRQFAFLIRTGTSCAR